MPNVSAGGSAAATAEDAESTVQCSTAVTSPPGAALDAAAVAEVWWGSLSSHWQLTVDIEHARERTSFECHNERERDVAFCTAAEHQRAFSPVFAQGVGFTGLLSVRLSGWWCPEHGSFSNDWEDAFQVHMYWLDNAAGRDLIYSRLRCGAF